MSWKQIGSSKASPAPPHLPLSLVIGGRPPQSSLAIVVHWSHADPVGLLFQPPGRQWAPGFPVGLCCTPQQFCMLHILPWPFLNFAFAGGHCAQASPVSAEQGSSKGRAKRSNQQMGDFAPPLSGSRGGAAAAAECFQEKASTDYWWLEVSLKGLLLLNGIPLLM